MSKFSRTEKQIADDLAQKIIGKVARKKIALARTGTIFIQKEFNAFPKPPIWSGASQANSFASLEVSTLSILLTMTIKTDYSKYFVKGLGSNKKYGERNPMTPAMRSLVEGVLEEMVK
jgi:hypothetical protein